MHSWSLQEAKAKLSQLVKFCAKEPQIITLHGKPQVIVISIHDYERKIGGKGSLVSFLKKSPLYGVELDLERDSSSGRELDL